MLRSKLAFIRPEPMWRITLEIQLSSDVEEKTCVYQVVGKI